MPLAIRCPPSNDRNALLNDTTARGVSCSKKCCARPARASSAHHPSPSTLPATNTTVISDMARQSKSFAQRKRGNAAALAAQSAQNRWKTHAWPAVMTPMHATPPAPEAAARHIAADGRTASIKPARTCGLCTTRGSTAVSPRRDAPTRHERPRG